MNLHEAMFNLSNGDTIHIVHGIGDQIDAAFQNWLIRAQTRDDEPWFKELSSECFAQYIESKGDYAVSYKDYVKEHGVPTTVKS
jgi:hypothetical protein